MHPVCRIGLPMLALLLIPGSLVPGLAIAHVSPSNLQIPIGSIVSGTGDRPAKRVQARMPHGESTWTPLRITLVSFTTSTTSRDRGGRSWIDLSSGALPTSG
jgi:hypothetical protein